MSLVYSEIFSDHSVANVGNVILIIRHFWWSYLWVYKNGCFIWATWEYWL